MSSNNNIQDELRDLNSELPKGGNEGPFAVPEGYFDGLAANLLARIKSTNSEVATELAEISPLLASIPRTMPYSLPPDYFQSNEDLGWVAEERKVLFGLDKEMPYSIPQGYFDTLPGALLQRVQPKAKVVSMGRKWMRMAAAAVITGIIGVSAFPYISGRNNTLDADKPIAQQLKNVSTKELDEFIKTTDITTGSSQTAQASVQKADVKKMLKDVSDTELEAFLNQVPTDEEDLTEYN